MCRSLKPPCTRLSVLYAEHLRMARRRLSSSGSAYPCPFPFFLITFCDCSLHLHLHLPPTRIYSRRVLRRKPESYIRLRNATAGSAHSCTTTEPTRDHQAATPVAHYGRVQAAVFRRCTQARPVPQNSVRQYVERARYATATDHTKTGLRAMPET